MRAPKVAALGSAGWAMQRPSQSNIQPW